MTYTKFNVRRSVTFAVIVALASLTAVISISTTQTAEAQSSCPAQDTSRGVVTSTFNVATSALTMYGLVCQHRAQLMTPSSWK
jgi:hypothetical protein